MNKKTKTVLKLLFSFIFESCNIYLMLISYNVCFRRIHPRILAPSWQGGAGGPPSCPATWLGRCSLSITAVNIGTPSM